jgi:CheY-like chemotaxis protein
VSQKRLLIVDHKRDMANALVALARGLGYHAEAVYSGDLALEHVRANPVDLLLIDLQMPGTSGWEVVRTLRADRMFDELPIVVCSAASSSKLPEEALRSGAQDYFAKDDAFEELDRIVRRHLRDATGKTT